LRRTAIKLSYRLLHRLGSIDLPQGAGDFRLVDRRALDQLRQMRESNRYVRGLVAWTGFRQIGVPYPRGARHAGRTKYPLGKLVTLGVDGLLGFSRAPLTIAIAFGFAVSSTAFGLGVVAIALRIANVGTVPGWASVVVVMSFLGGVQLIVTGMVGTYVGRIYEEVKGRPLYVLRETKGLEAEHLPLSGARVAGSPPVGR
jgi:dolichol-phosphate mannosyltransferase